MKHITIALAGNPNVGKSTIFNALTHLHQHTGNWPGKTVANATGRFQWKEYDITVVDLPGTYSLRSGSMEEEIARDYIKSGEADLIICVADATALQRNLSLILQIQQLTTNMIVYVNLLDEAEKKRIHVDLDRLSQQLQLPVIGTSARSGKGLNELKEEITRHARSSSHSLHREVLQTPEAVARESQRIFAACVSTDRDDPHAKDRILDQIFTSRLTGYPVMIMLLCLIFWITISGANLPSQWLSDIFTVLRTPFEEALSALHFSGAVRSLLIDGLYTTVTWVVSVMLPPMAIFFPLFTLLEDSGYLPRIAFNLDHCFHCCGGNGKQALTTCMGFGCNACAVTGCRIIESPRERMIAILTNALIPCNGKFAALIAVLTVFFAGTVPEENASLFTGLIPALLLTTLILVSFMLTLLLSKLLSLTVLRGLPSTFALELPPYRRPQFGKVILRSLLDRTVFVLGRAICVAAPAGVLIWILARTETLPLLISALDPLGKLMGLDGAILTAFLLGLPANEIVIPILLMIYQSTGVLTDYASLTELHLLLTSHGWTQTTAICFLLFSVVHFPCGTTILTIQKETKSRKWTALAVVLPTLTGFLLCTIVHAIL